MYWSREGLGRAQKQVTLILIFKVKKAFKNLELKFFSIEPFESKPSNLNYVLTVQRTPMSLKIGDLDLDL